MKCLAAASTLMILFTTECLADSDGRIYTSIAVATEQRINGVSTSDGHPVWEASVFYWRPDNFYAGVWATRADYDDPGNTSVEIDTYVGKKWFSGGTEIKAEIMYSAFNDHVPGPTYDFVQLKLDVARTFEQLELRAQSAWSPEGAYGAGAMLQMRGIALYRAADWLTFRALVGHGSFQHRHNRFYWETGLIAKRGRFSFDIRYVDTDLSVERCGFRDWCKPAVIGRLTVEGPSFPLAFWHE